MIAERKKGKNKGSKLIAFFLAFALVLAGIGTFAGLEGVFSMRAKAAPGDVEINETNFPDENFRNYLLAQTYGADALLTPTEIAGTNYTPGIINLSLTSKNISDLTGIEHFTALQYLYCGNNNLTTLDVSHNTNLRYLDCYNNNLTTLDVSSNTLETLRCYNNQLTELTLNNVEQLYCSGNNLTTLVVSGCEALWRLDCSNNNLTALDVSHNPSLEYLYCEFNNLTTLDVSSNTLMVTHSGWGPGGPYLRCYRNPFISLKIPFEGGTVTVSNGGRETFNPLSVDITGKNLVIVDPVSTDPGYVFDHWEITGEGTTQQATSVTGVEASETPDAICDATSFSVGSENATITAVWTSPSPTTHTLTVNEIYLYANGTTEKTETSTSTHEDGEEVTITKTAPAGYTLYGEASQTFTMDEDKTIVFTYVKEPETYTLTINEVYQDENGDEERTVTSTETYTDGEEATVTKTAPDGYSIVGDATQTVTMNGNKTVTFTYKKNSSGTGGGGGTIPIVAEEYKLTINEVYQNANGSVERTTTSSAMTSGGEVITLTANVPDGYSIVGDATQTVTMNGNKTVTFTYKKNSSGTGGGGGTTPTPPAPKPKYTITFTDGFGNTLLSEAVEQGQATPIPADPAREGYEFIGWSPSIASTVTGTTSYTALWKEAEKPKCTVTIISTFVDKDGNIETKTETVQYYKGEVVTIQADNINGYAVVGEDSKTFVVMDDETTVQFVYQKEEDDPEPIIDPNPPLPDPEPDPIPEPQPDPTPEPTPDPGNGGNGGGGIPITPPIIDNGDNSGGDDTKQPDNTYEEPDNKKPDDTDKPSDDTKKPDDKEKTDNDKPTPVIPDDSNKPDEGNKPQPTNPDNGDKPSDGDTPDKADTSDDQNDTSNWLTDNTPEGKALRRNVAIGVTTGGIIVTLVATGALKYLWLLLLLLFFKFKSVKFHGILTNEKNKYIKVKATDKNEDALSLQGYAKLLDTANDIREAAVSSGYVTELPMGTTMMIEYADRIEKMKADENKMYELLSEARGKVGVNLINKAAKFDVRLDFNL